MTAQAVGFILGVTSVRTTSDAGTSPSLAPIDGAGSIQDSGLTSFHCIPIKEQVDENEEVELSE